MLEKIKTTANRLLAIGFMAAVLIMILVGTDIYQKSRQTAGLPENNLLKAPKEKIIDYETITAENSNGLKKDASAVVKYRYLSAKTVPAETYRGLKEDLSKRTDNSQTFLKSTKPISTTLQQNEYITKFYTGSTFQKSGKEWHQIETATTTPAAFARQTSLTILDRAKELLGQKVLADTFYSGAGDGEVDFVDYDTIYSWTIAHDASVGTGAYYTGYDYISTGAGEGISSRTAFYRAFFPFDTSLLPDDAIIASATLNLYIWSNNLRNDSYGFITVIQTTQDSNLVLATSDYSKCGAISNPTEGVDAANRLSQAGVNLNNYNSFPLNATGISWISKTGYTKLGVREGHDVLNIPTGFPVSYASTYASERTGTSQDPYLDVTYTIITNAVKIDGGTIKLDGGTIKID
ncbi:MAG: hypothetical protein WC768_04795 [Patescibacteria group bacterium]|jgi:hypothetical protein